MQKGSHFDERTKINPADHNQNGQHLVFMVQYFGNVIDGSPAAKMYLLYDDNVLIMDRIFGDEISGFYALNVGIDARISCKPYAFFVVTESFEIYRLPEDEHYFFSTSMIEVVDAGKCKVNHFHKASRESPWTENGSPDVFAADNPYCNGCAESDVLSRHFGHFINMELAADMITIKPTVSPTVMPTNTPSLVPTNTPTQIPTRIPSQTPTHSPSTSPTSFVFEL